ALVALVLVSAPILLGRIPAGAMRYGFFFVLGAGLALLVIVAVGGAILRPLRHWRALRHPIELLEQAHRILLSGPTALPVMALAVLSHVVGSAILWIAAR